MDTYSTAGDCEALQFPTAETPLVRRKSLKQNVDRFIDISVIMDVSLAVMDLVAKATDARQ